MNYETDLPETYYRTGTDKRIYPACTDRTEEMSGEGLPITGKNLSFTEATGRNAFDEEQVSGIYPGRTGEHPIPQAET